MCDDAFTLSSLIGGLADDETTAQLIGSLADDETTAKISLL